MMMMLALQNSNFPCLEESNNNNNNYIYILYMYINICEFNLNTNVFLFVFCLFVGFAKSPLSFALAPIF